MLAQLETGPDTMESQESTLESSAREPEPESNLESESELESDDSEGDQKSYKSFNDAFFWSIFAGAGVNFRITSYNVCYTKLLRAVNHNG